jgi:hypothetical protein
MYLQMKGGSGQADKQAVIVSHERSGTHFLMNTLALNFAYIAKPWVNFDFQLGLNLYHSTTALEVFRSIKGNQLKNITKSHHPFPFFADFIDYLSEIFYVFYIYRDPRDVMLSFWEFIREIPWDEGPQAKTVGSFMRSAPRGAMLRYQKEQMPTVLHRWESHVDGWVTFGERHKNKIILIRYEELNLRFHETVKSIGEIIGRAVPSPVRPGLHDNVVYPGKGAVGRYKKYFLPEDHEFLENTVGRTMVQLGYNKR